MGRKYIDPSFSVKKRFYYNDGRNYRDVVVRGLSVRRLSANNPKPYTRESGTADISSHKFYTYPAPIVSFGTIVNWSTPNAPGYTLPTLGDPDFKLMRDNVVSSLYGKVKDFKNNANLLNMFGERNKTIDMISLRLSQAHSLLKKARKPLLNLERKARRHPNNLNIKRELANKRLEYAYGWAPLMKDLHQICGELHEPPSYVSVRSTRKVYYTNTDLASNGSESIVNNYYKKVTGVLKLELSAPILASASSLGLENPAVLAWELTPYSFVVDWFLPIGSYLENLSALNGFKIVGGSLTLSTRGDRTLTRKKVGGSSYSNFRHMSRVNLSMSVPFPNLKNPFSIAHTLNALALIAQLKPKRNHYEYTE